MDRRLKELSLFSGGGGGILAGRQLGFSPIGIVEWDEDAQKVLRRRMDEGHIECCPIFGSIDSFISEGYAHIYKGVANIITAGFPCQPFSVAGERKGTDDSRNKWPATAATIRIVQPELVFLENVRGLLSATHYITLQESVGYFGIILAELSEMGYDAKWGVVSARNASAFHLRERLWILASNRSCT